MDGRWWEPNFSLSKWEFTDKQEEEAGYVIMDSSSRHQCELMFNLIYRSRGLCIELLIDVYTHGLVYTQVFHCCVSWESLEAITSGGNEHT